MTDDAIALPRYNECFVCGNENQAGLDVTFWYRNGRIETDFTPEPKFSGFQSVTHGGVLATILDECMGWSCILSRPIMAYTAEMTLRYHSHASPNVPLVVYGELVSDKKRMILARGGVERPDGEKVCSGEGKYIPLPPDQLQSVIEYAGWNGRFERLYEEIQARKAK